MLQKQLLLTATVTALCAFALSGLVAAQTAISLGTSSVGSSFYVLSVGMSKIIQKHGEMNVSVESLGGSHANMFGIARGKVDFAMANAGATYDAFHGNAPFKKPTKLRLVAQGQSSFRGIFFTKSSGITKIEDMAGKTFLAKRKPLPELEKLANAVLDVYGLPRSKVKLVSSRNLGEMNRVMRAGSVDATAYPFSLRQPVMVKLFNDNIVTPLILPEDKYDHVKKQLPKIFFKHYIKPNSFKNQPEGFWTFGLRTQVATGARQDEATVYRFTKALLGNTAEFSKYHGLAKQWNTKKTLSNPTVPFHPGAIRYFKEIGKWSAKLEKAQARLLKRM
jgi:TRAP transporter TAXI family solute receptor